MSDILISDHCQSFDAASIFLVFSAPFVVVLYRKNPLLSNKIVAGIVNAITVYSCAVISAVAASHCVQIPSSAKNFPAFANFTAFDITI